MIKGELVVDDGCEKALITEGSSLLSVGIVEVKGTFDQGNSVRILSKQGREIARGLANYNSEEIKKICGKNTNNISKILGSKLYDEVIHRDNMVIMV